MTTKQPAAPKTARRNYTDKERRALLKQVKLSPNVCHAADKLGIARSTASRWHKEHLDARALTRARQSAAMKKLRDKRKAADSAPWPAGVPVPDVAGAVKLMPPAAPMAAPKAAGGQVVLSADEAKLVMSLVRQALKSSDNLAVVRDAAALALRLLP